jgi:hypothetical protein
MRSKRLQETKESLERTVGHQAPTSKDIPPEKSRETNVFSNLKETVDLVGKMAIGIVGSCYVLGMIVVNVYLNNFGVFAPSLFRLNYIVAGMWVLAPIAFGSILMWSLVAFVAITFPNVQHRISRLFGLRITYLNKGERRLTMAVLFVCFCATVFSVVWVRSNMIKLIPKANMWEPMGTGFVTSVYPLVALPLFYLSIRHIFSRFVGLVLLITISICLLFMHSYTFAMNTYGTIPAYLGGGQAKDVQLVINSEKEKRQFFRELGIQFLSDESNITVNVKLLLTTEDEYVLLVETQKQGRQVPTLTGLTIPKDKVDAVLYEGVSFRGTGGDSSY